MAFVLDCSVALTWLLPDEQSDRADDLAKNLATSNPLAPAIWPLEVGNVLWSAHRQGRITMKEIVTIRKALLELPVRIDPAPVELLWGQTLDLAIKHQITLYDASYLDLAIRRSIPLATFDKKLAQAAQGEGLVLLV